MTAMSTLSLQFLGPPAFERDRAPRALARAKGVALLLFLAVTRVAQPRERVLDLLWPESLPQAARKNMRNTLWAIGEALGTDALLQDGPMLQLAPGVIVDLQELEDGLLLLEGGAVAALEAVVAQYRGPLADGLVVHEAPEFEIWLATERERLATVYLRLAERVIALRRAEGDWPAVAAHAQRALAVDPLREQIHLELIEASIRQGQRAQAAHQYSVLSELLRRELDVAPLPETQARYEALLAEISRPSSPRLPVRHHKPLAPAAPFVGREAELAALDQELQRSAHGEARVVVISGDLGMGKSQLWRTWAATRARGARVLVTHALEIGEPLPFGTVLTLFRQPGPARDMLGPRSPLPLIWLAELARALPEISGSWPDLPEPLALSPAEERVRLFQALTEAVRMLAQTGAVLVIDDLHWADSSTLDWLVFLVDSLSQTPLLLIATVRPQDSERRLAATLAGWQRQGRLRMLALPHLTTNQSRELLTALGPAVDTGQAEQWIHQSGGNPYFLIELQRSPSGLAISDLATLVRARLQETVPASALQVLQAAAVLGEDATFGMVRATSGRSDEETLDALDTLVAAAVLAEADRVYRFVHPLVAVVIRQDLLPARRAFLHRRAAQTLERSYGAMLEQLAARLSEHYAAAGDHEQAAHYAEQATRQALAVGAFVEAAEAARRALQWAATPERQLLLGEALFLSGSAIEAREQLELALQAFERANDPRGRTRASILLAQLAITKSEPEEAHSWLMRAPLDLIRERDPALAIQAHLRLAAIERQSEAYGAAADQLGLAEQLLQKHPAPSLGAQVAFERGNLFGDQGERQPAIAAFAEAYRLAQAGADPVFTAMAQNNLAYQTLLSGGLAIAQQHIREATELTDRYALSFLVQYVQSTAGEIALAQGDLDTAERAFAQAFEAASAWENRVHMANLRVNQALAARAQGNHASAQTLLAEARKLFSDSIDPFVKKKIARAELGTVSSYAG